MNWHGHSNSSFLTPAQGTTNLYNAVDCLSNPITWCTWDGLAFPQVLTYPVTSSVHYAATIGTWCGHRNSFSAFRSHHTGSLFQDADILSNMLFTQYFGNGVCDLGTGGGPPNLESVFRIEGGLL